MDESRRKLIIDGNAFYELDMDCLEKRGRTAGHPRDAVEMEQRRTRKKRGQRK